MRRLAIILIGLYGSVQAQLSINLPDLDVPEGTTQVVIPVVVSGGVPLTDMTGVVQLGDGGPLVGGTAGPVFVALDYTGSIWESAPGNFRSFFPSVGPPEQIIDPNVTLEEPNESVTASGIVFTITVDLSGQPAGIYDILMVDTQGGDTQFFNGEQEVFSVINNGSIRIRPDIERWRQEHFPQDYLIPVREETIWGDQADPDEDGLLNCVEYALGTDPRSRQEALASALVPGKPSSQLFPLGNQTFLQLRYTRRINAIGFGFQVETAPDVSGPWVDASGDFAAVAPPVTLPGGDYELVQLQSVSALNNAENPRFIRVFAQKP